MASCEHVCGRYIVVISVVARSLYLLSCWTEGCSGSCRRSFERGIISAIRMEKHCKMRMELQLVPEIVPELVIVKRRCDVYLEV